MKFEIWYRHYHKDWDGSYWDTGEVIEVPETIQDQGFGYREEIRDYLRERLAEHKLLTCSADVVEDVLCIAPGVTFAFTIKKDPNPPKVPRIVTTA